ncbi:MAG: YfbK domain-containing protein [Flavobacterium sp.]
MASFKTNAKDKAVVDNTPRNSRDGDINTEVSNSLQGRAAGVTVNTAAGQPGSGNTTVILRGAGTLYGNQEPLYIIDGVPANADNMKSIDPNNIESVSVIKDGATDIFGSRGANGVIVVTTKESKKMSKRQFRKLQKKRYEQWQKENTPSVIIRDAAAPTSDPKAQTEKQEEKIPVDTEEYEAFDENKFESPASNPLSTFSIDVDNASYTNVRRFINNAQRVPKDAVRVEEMINFFKYSYPQPSSVHPFSINTEYSDCPWNPKHKLLKIGLQGKDIPARELPASNFVFLIDVSGSMDAQNKLPLLKESMKILVKNMRREDRIAIVVYAGAAGLVLPATRGDEKETIVSALNKLNAGGSTAGGEGIELAYKIAQENFVKGGNNRVILATDGDFNVGRTSNTDMQTLIEEKRKSGVFLTCLGYGMGNYKDSKLETLSDKGNGNYAYIDNMQEADRFLDKEFKGSMYAIAKDVKIQIEFNPSHVQAYRLIGYENRKLRNEDFANDAIDAGELGSGHTVTALYEIIPPGVENDFVTAPELKYSQVQQNGNQYSSELATIKFRYKKPDGDKSTEIVQTIADTAVSLAVASGDFKFAAAVAWFGLKLRNSKLVPNKDVEAIKKLATEGILTDPEGYRAEFIRLVNRIE